MMTLANLDLKNILQNEMVTVLASYEKIMIICIKTCYSVWEFCSMLAEKYIVFVHLLNTFLKISEMFCFLTLDAN